MDILEKLNAKKEAKRFVVKRLIVGFGLLAFGVIIISVSSIGPIGGLFVGILIGSVFMLSSVFSIFSKKFQQALDKTGWTGKRSKVKDVFPS